MWHQFTCLKFKVLHETWGRTPVQSNMLQTSRHSSQTGSGFTFLFQKGMGDKCKEADQDTNPVGQAPLPTALCVTSCSAMASGSPIAPALPVPAQVLSLCSATEWYGPAEACGLWLCLALVGLLAALCESAQVLGDPVPPWAGGSLWVISGILRLCAVHCRQSPCVISQVPIEVLFPLLHLGSL